MEYNELHDVLGNIYGTGDGSYTLEWVDENNDGMMQPEEMIEVPSTFSLPDLRGRVPVGLDNMGGITAGVVTTNGDNLGNGGGEELHQLTEDEMPIHNHEIPEYTQQPVGYGAGYKWTQGTNNYGGPVYNHPTGNSGGDQPHNNMQPYIILNYLIKY